MKFLKNFSFTKLLSSRRFKILLSILISFSLWVGLTLNEKNIIDRTFSDLSISVNLEDTYAAENKMSIIGDISQQRFTVTVRGSGSNVGRLTASDISLYASAASVDSPGKYSLDVLSSSTDSDYEIISISPKTVEVEFDYIETKEFTIKAVALGATAPKGLIADVASVSATQGNLISITGPRTILNKIETVAAVAEVNKTLNQSETFDADIVLYDLEGNKIDQTYLSLSVANVKVTVPIAKKKEVPVKIQLAGYPEGFDTESLSYTLDHSKVAIIGTPETIEKIQEVVLNPIDIRGLTPSNKTFEVTAKLPEGVRLLDNIEYFKVTFNLKNYTEKTINISNIKYKGLSSGLQAKNDGIIKNVKICGPSSVLRNIGEDDAYALIDLTDKIAGTHTVDALINFNDIKKVWSIGEYKTTVTVK